MENSKTNIDLNLKEIKPNNESNKVFPIAITILSVAVVALLVYMFCENLSKNPTFRSDDGKVRITASKEWSKVKIENKSDSSSNSEIILALLKQDNKLAPSMIFVSRIINLEDSNIDEIYTRWKKLYEKNAFILTGIETINDKIPDVAEKVRVSKYDARQVCFSQTNVLAIKNARFYTIVETNNAKYLISGTTVINNKSSFQEEYKNILDSIKDKK